MPVAPRRDAIMPHPKKMVLTYQVMLKQKMSL